MEQEKQQPMTVDDEPDGVHLTIKGSAGTGLSYLGKWLHFATIQPLPMFPASVTINGASIRLLANGTWEGDVDAFEAALKDVKQVPGDALTMPIAWLILNAIKRDKR